MPPRTFFSPLNELLRLKTPNVLPPHHLAISSPALAGCSGGFFFFFFLLFSPPLFSYHLTLPPTLTHKKKSPVLLCWAEIQNKLQPGGEWLGRIKRPSCLPGAAEIEYWGNLVREKNDFKGARVDALRFPCGCSAYFVLNNSLIWGWR